MGPANPWSPNWRPDPSGRRHIAIRAARRGAVLAAALYVPVGIAAAVVGGFPIEVGAGAVLIGVPGVALLGAGLAPAALGSPIDTVVVGVAMVIGAPVAAVTSLVIASFVVGTLAGDDGELAGTILRAGVTSAMGVVPLVIVAVTIWVLAVRRVSQPAL
jgi:hypothetical protein